MTKRVTLQIVASLNDNTGDIIYNCNMFMGVNSRHIFRHRHQLHARGGGSLLTVYLFVCIWAPQTSMKGSYFAHSTLHKTSLRQARL
jgi:hypothetical protein